MGQINTKKFKRRDNIEGQGKDVLIYAKKMGLKASELNRFYHEFAKLEGASGFIDLEEFYMQHGVAMKPFTNFLMRQFEITKTGRLYFLQFMVTMWNLLTADDDALAAFLFAVFNPNQSDSLDSIQAKFIIKALWDFNPPAEVLKALDRLSENVDGVVTNYEFLLCCQYCKSMFYPIHTIRNKIQKKLIYPRIWRELALRRKKMFPPTKTIFEIIEWWDQDFISANISWLERQDTTPQEEVDIYNDVQAKKLERDRLPLELPDHLLTAEDKRLLGRERKLQSKGKATKSKHKIGRRKGGESKSQPRSGFGKAVGLGALVNENVYTKSRYKQGRPVGQESQDVRMVLNENGEEVEDFATLVWRSIESTLEDLAIEARGDDSEDEEEHIEYEYDDDCDDFSDVEEAVYANSITKSIIAGQNKAEGKDSEEWLSRDWRANKYEKPASKM